ncbi:MAG: hemerythrin domain-containing protein [Geminicoccaceae bacterium]
MPTSAAASSSNASASSARSSTAPTPRHEEPTLTDLDLDHRTGWPPELCVLLDRHPRESWPTAGGIGPTGRFWLQRHDLFRELTRALDMAARELREGRVDAARFVPWFRPRMGFLLQELHGHHRIEDLHYFPVFQAADPRLARGFQVLDADHHTIDRAIAELGTASDTLLRALASTTDDRPGAIAGLATTLPAFLDRLLRHLDDEEDLVIPLLIERGEGSLGMG